ncbi:MAG: alpha/beta fold hydrolase [Jatrophihabitantaceae bacterium]
MSRPDLRELPRSSKVLAALFTVLALAAAIALVIQSQSDPVVHTRSQFIAGTPEAGASVSLDTTLYLPAKTPAPAVLLAHGFGGTKADLDGQARTLAQHGYVVLAYTARGFGHSGGLVHLDSPQYEVHDASLLVTYLTTLSQVERKDGKPQIAVAGSSYGGALALLLAGTDKRITAVAADITWNSLAHALFPNATGTVPGVFKKIWAGYLFQAGLGSGQSQAGLGSGQTTSAGEPTTCGRFAADICAAYQYAAQTGRPNAAMLSLLNASSPAEVLSKITAPTLLTQGEQDSLFGLSEADANARGIAANGTPVRVIWRAGGHDSSSTAGSDVTSAMLSWFGAAFGPGIHGTQPFTIDEGAKITSDGQARVRDTIHVDAYPGLGGGTAQARVVPIAGPPQTITAPAGGNPAAITALPILGAALGQLGQFSPGAQLSAIPGQFATFLSAPLSADTEIVGTPTVTLTVTARASADAVLFLALRDVAPDGSQVLPSNLVAPLHLTGLHIGVPQTVAVRLPSISQDVFAGHRLAVTVATTDLGYQLPVDARTYMVALDSGSAALVVPTVTGSIVHVGTPIAWLITGIATALLIGSGVWLLLRRRRLALHADASLATVPIVITDLVKEYGDGYRAVDGVSFRVEAGQVVGLLGPNGAGKTTTLRVLVGLIIPTSGTVHVFGDPVVPGAPVLARIGAFIEGPGFLPHLSGRENLELYWAASGRPDAEADFETALQIAGLGTSVERRVRTYSHGMKQRLGIAQAMLGLPEVLVLDEPTNGLDPPQIAEMREVLQSYAATGRTVVVSSHLLAEVEQTCTHVVMMHKGRLVAAGSVAEIAGAGAMQLAVPDPGEAMWILAAAGITAHTVPARRALEDVFLDLVGDHE